MTTTIKNPLDVRPHTGDVLAWIDVETTGLDPQENHLLEVACILTDTKLRPLREPFHRVLFYDSTDWIKDETSPYVVDMHEKTGLWDKLQSGTPRRTVDTELLEYISSVAPATRQARVAGNSVRLDLNFLEQFLPETYHHLHYRSVDVSAIEYILREWQLLDDPPAEHEPEHTALGDITASIAQLYGVLSDLDGTKTQRDAEFG